MESEREALHQGMGNEVRVIPLIPREPQPVTYPDTPRAIHYPKIMKTRSTGNWPVYLAVPEIRRISEPLQIEMEPSSPIAT